MKVYLLGVFLAIFAGICLASDMTMKVFELRQSQAEQLIPVIKPLLPEGSGVSGTGNKLIIKSTPKAISQVASLLPSIDKLPEQLLISVRRVHNAAHDTRVKSFGDVDVYSTQTRKEQDSAQQIRVLSGHGAFIQVGESFPVRDRRDLQLFGIVYDNPTEYKEIRSGYYVTPYVYGNKVKLDISWQHEAIRDDANRLLRDNSAIDQESLGSAITAPLGEWVLLGDSSTQSLRIRDKNVYNTYDLEYPDSDVYIKVDKVIDKSIYHADYPQGHWENSYSTAPKDY